MVRKIIFIAGFGQSSRWIFRTCQKSGRSTKL